MIFYTTILLIFYTGNTLLHTALGKDNRPADTISGEAANTFLVWLSDKIASITENPKETTEHDDGESELTYKVKRPTDCGDLDKSNCKSGIYQIFPDKTSGFKVFCEMKKHGGGWTVIQRRMNGKTTFYRDWYSYKRGFGNQYEEFWLGSVLTFGSKVLVPHLLTSNNSLTVTPSSIGLDRSVLFGNDHLHQLTSQGKYKLRIDLKDFENNRKYALYEKFSVGRESSGYVLDVGGYSGDAGDSMAYQNGMKFSTKDKDNDNYNRGSCAVKFKGAWWYKRCHYSNLNGPYRKGNHKSYADGVNWYNWKGYYYSLKETVMMIRKA